MAVRREEAWSSIILKQNRGRVGLSGIFSSQVKIDSSYTVRYSSMFDNERKETTDETVT